MKRMHLHVGVDNIEEGVAFYTALFGADPIKIKPDYAKWMLDDPRINFAISTRSGKKGLDHLGIQVESEAELDEIRDRIHGEELEVFDEGTTVCCYAESDKLWLQDPAGIAWEAYHTMAEAQLFSYDKAADDNACCSPAIPVVDNTNCCEPADKNSGCC